MSSASMADLLKQAEEAGISSFEPTPGNYDLVVRSANASKTKKGDPKFGVQFAIEGGPDDGKSFWTNYNLIAVKNDGTPNNAGLAITFRDLAALGAPADVVVQWDVDSPTITEDVNAALAGTRINADVAVKQSGGYTNIDVKKIRRRGEAAGTDPLAPPSPSAATPAADAPPF